MADDKFILLGLDDSRAGKIAEVLKNKTCKKMLDFLAETKEASEKDISKALNIPINTIEYNLKKLIKASLVKKAKNFFWSVKGRKIPMYSLAKKHIIISPNKKPSVTALKSILPITTIIAAIALLVIIAFVFSGPEPIVNENKLQQFSSQAELEDFIKENSKSGGIYNEILGGISRTVTMEIEESVATGAADSAAGSAAPKTATQASEYSETNIQVEGVDEADIVKNDGKYIYVVTGNKVAIVNAYPAENMEVIGEINLSKSISEIFINDNKLIVFSSGYEYIPYTKGCVAEEGIDCGGYSKYNNLVYIYNVADKENPELEKKIEIDGSYVDSRMIGDSVYVISSKYVNTNTPEPPIYRVNGVETKVIAEEIYYWPYPDTNYVFTSIMAIDVEDGDLNSEVYLTGSSRTLYISQNNIYLTYQKRVNYENYAEEIAEAVYLAILPEKYDEKIQEILSEDKELYLKLESMNKLVFEYSNSLKGKEKSDFDKRLSENLEEFNLEIQKQMEKTVIHKINIDKDKIEYKGAGEVPGRILNQFSMDEYNENFRIATTTGNTWQETSLNHLYVLNKDLEIIGKVEDLARGERIYSTRFMGERAYMVTFRQVDPFYVLDLSNPEKPTVLGYLKIPGYSSYLHPYDENHIIGLGAENNAVKLSLFDVTDVENPVEIDKYNISEGVYSNSEALNEHKAFLFDKSKNLLVIPVGYNKITGYKSNNNGYEYPVYEYWQGAFVFNLNLEQGFRLKGKVSHYSDSDDRYKYHSSVRRSLYMDDILYTISQRKIKANNLQTIEEISSVDLPYEVERYPYVIEKRGDVGVAIAEDVAVADAEETV